MATWTVTVEEVEESAGSVVKAFGTAAVSGTYTSGGDVFSFANTAGKLIPTGFPPIGPVQVIGKAGFVYQFSRGTTLANGLLLIFCNTAGGSNAALGEHTAASVVAGVTGDTIRWEASFRRQ